MTCPNCGADMPEDSLYCEQCGEDIHIVPDFDPSFDFQLDPVWKEESVFTPEDVPENLVDVAQEKPQKRKISIVLILIAGCLVLLGIWWTIRLVLYHSYEYQERSAQTAMSKAQYQKAISYFERALALTEEDVELFFDIAECYRLLGNQIEYEYWIRKVLREEGATNEQQERAYDKLIAIFADRGDYQTINLLISESNSANILDRYQNYIANVPMFSYPEGEYTEIVPLKLTASAQGTIYYTLSGSEPTTQSKIYDSLIYLDDGDHIVKAIFENRYGIISDSVTKEYKIVIPKAPPPKLSIPGGTYQEPTWIAVTNAKDGNVYYTTDGTDPTLHSTQYALPMPMPIGRSHYKFAQIQDDGSVGEITDVTFQLTLVTDLTVEKATELVTNAVAVQKASMYEQYIYEVLYVADIGEGGDCYVIAEMRFDDTGTLQKTGSYYAINIYDSVIHKLQIEQENRYQLLEVIPPAMESDNTP
ncbi:MAG: chitobiase/beta-hexosaminidase C-terminal domain-containing protein [Lachnospiraceae bacterium]|nr:chitobiase/beta-hexosaminidase C-terminal domain-containing protein [Lachnospiraceae bacterium]